MTSRAASITVNCQRTASRLPCILLLVRQYMPPSYPEILTTRMISQLLPQIAIATPQGAQDPTSVAELISKYFETNPDITDRIAEEVVKRQAGEGGIAAPNTHSEGTRLAMLIARKADNSAVEKALTNLD